MKMTTSWGVRKHAVSVILAGDVTLPFALASHFRTNCRLVNFHGPYTSQGHISIPPFLELVEVSETYAHDVQRNVMKVRFHGFLTRDVSQ